MFFRKQYSFYPLETFLGCNKDEKKFSMKISARIFLEGHFYDFYKKFMMNYQKINHSLEYRKKDM